jgi:maltose O-acetyltransferase
MPIGRDRLRRLGRRGAIICPGVTIGSRTIIGAGSVVTGNIPEAVFAAGNPCRVLRNLTT